jgi:hypothetical protein
MARTASSCASLRPSRNRSGGALVDTSQG